MINIGDLAPNFTLPASDGKTYSLTDFIGKNIILYFYPKDNTPGCTTQACNFRDNYSTILDKNYIILGISKDSTNSHNKFIEKFNLPFLLLSDEEKVVCELYNVLKEKTMFGKKAFGIERSTFLIDTNGILIKEFRKVKAKDHITEILENLN